MIANKKYFCEGTSKQTFYEVFYCFKKDNRVAQNYIVAGFLF